MKKVTVLLSTYNGHRYIREQLDSLIVQEGVQVSIVVRDDGSTDATLSILEEYKTKCDITIISEPNCGVQDSFTKLCFYAVENVVSDYYAFCDQDDIWDRTKLFVATEKLLNFSDEVPNLYHSNLFRVDENLAPIGYLYKPGEVLEEKEKALVQVFAYGCTCVFNRRALELYCRIGKNLSYHEVWLYVLCSYLGNVYYDKGSYIKYRQHNNNVTAHKSSGWELFSKRIKRFFMGNLGHDYEVLAKQLLKYSDLISSEDLVMINHVANYRYNIRSKIYLLFTPIYSTGRLAKDICIKFRILINRL